MKRFEAISFEMAPKAIKSREASIQKDISDIVDSPASSSFGFLMYSIGVATAMAHLELPGLKLSIRDCSQTAREQYIRYLTSDWWKGTKHEQLDWESVNKDLKYKRTEDSNDLTWFYSGRIAALHAALFSDVETLQKIADWCEPWMLPEPRPLGVDPLVGKAFLVLLKDFRTQGKFDVTKLETELKASRKKGPKLLYNLWCAVREKDQAEFEKLAIESVQQFEKTMPSERFTALDQVDIDTSLFVAAGRLKGMDLPDFPEQTLLRLMTYETVTAGESKAKPKKKK